MANVSSELRRELERVVVSDQPYKVDVDGPTKDESHQNCHDEQLQSKVELVAQRKSTEERKLKRYNIALEIDDR